MSRLRAGHRAAALGVGAVLREPARRQNLERGQTVEAVIIYPLILGLIFVMIQAGIWVHARSAALNAAHEGALAAASYRSGESGAGTAESVIGASSTGLFHDVSASESRQ